MIQALILYGQFFTRLPIPVEIDEPLERMANGVTWFSFFGFLIGLFEAGCCFLFAQIFPLPLSFLLTLFVDILLTGGFHLDALSDMADGLFSSRNPERMLEIMKDSRVGSNGVLAVVMYYGMLMGILLSFPVLDMPFVLAVVVGFNLIGKTGISLLFYRMTYAGSTQGLGKAFLNVKTYKIMLAQLFSLIVLYLLFHWAGVIALVSVFISSLIYRRIVYGKVSGFNGDTLGAFACISQVIFLMTLYLARMWLV